MPSVSVVIPCLNEAAGITPTVEAAYRALAGLGLGGDVVVCDNGSDDGSESLALTAGASVVLEQRIGYGFAVLAGIRASKGEIIVTTDADDTFDFDQLPNLVDPILRGTADYVNGTRLHGWIQPGAMPLSHRYFGTPAMNWFLWAASGIRSSDVNTGIRAMTRMAFESMHASAGGAELTSQFELRSRYLRLRCAEIPVSYRRRLGQSKLRPFRDALRHFKLTVREAAVHPRVTKVGADSSRLPKLPL